MLRPPMHHRLRVAILLALGVAGCSRDAEDSPKPTGERTRDPVPETPKDAPTGPFAKFDFAAAADRWQGAWRFAGESPIADVAWNVAGDRVTQLAGDRGPDAAEASFRFAIYSPCQITFTDDEAGETTYVNFVFVGDQLHAGLGATGVVLGESIVVCGSDGEIHVLTGDTCLRWSEMFDDWKSKPATCRVAGEGAERVFVVGETQLSFVGDALLEASMRDSIATKHADYAAAKAARGSLGTR
jgi:hypothetical protein